MIKRIFCILMISALMLCAFCTVALAADDGVAPYATEKPSLDTDPTGGAAGGENSDSTGNGGNGSGSTDNGSGNSGTNGNENGASGGINPITVVVLISVPTALAAAAGLVYISVKKKK